MCEAFDEHAPRVRASAAHADALRTTPHRARSPNSNSCAARWSARSRWRSAPAPIGVFLMLRRMSLVGDAMAHAILPGAAVGFLLSGLSLFAMTAGGLDRRLRGRARRRRWSRARPS